jgi:GMP synthase (glutamine-hydrolysing)
MRVAIVENMENTHIGALGKALEEAQAAIEWFRPWKDGAIPQNIDSYDALIVLGGEQNAIDDEEYPYLPALAALMRRFGDADRSVLGICLGSQVLARGYGSENLLGAAREFAWTDVDVSDAGRDDPLFAELGERFTTFEWHSDTFALPEGAVRLASTPAVPNQCFRVGRAVYGTQFHFEADLQVVKAWNVEFSDQVERLEPGWLGRFPETAARHAGDADRAGLAIARAFVGTIQPADASKAASLAEATA